MRRKNPTSAATKSAAWALLALALLIFYEKAHQAPALVARPESRIERAMAGAAAAMVRGAVNDPGSLQFTYVGSRESTATVCTKYRARNGFGGMVTEQVVIVHQQLRNEDGAWSAHCRGLRDYTDDYR